MTVIFISYHTIHSLTRKIRMVLLMLRRFGKSDMKVTLRLHLDGSLDWGQKVLGEGQRMEDLRLGNRRIAAEGENALWSIHTLICVLAKASP